MAGITLLERVTGTVDGVNRDFSIPLPYISGTLHVFQNGPVSGNRGAAAVGQQGHLRAGNDVVRRAGGSS